MTVCYFSREDLWDFQIFVWFCLFCILQTHLSDDCAWPSWGLAWRHNNVKNATFAWHTSLAVKQFQKNTPSVLHPFQFVRPYLSSSIYPLLCSQSCCQFPLTFYIHHSSCNFVQPTNDSWHFKHLTPFNVTVAVTVENVTARGPPWEHFTYEQWPKYRPSSAVRPSIWTVPRCSWNGHCICCAAKQISFSCWSVCCATEHSQFLLLTALLCHRTQ